MSGPSTGRGVDDIMMGAVTEGFVLYVLAEHGSPSDIHMDTSPPPPLLICPLSGQLWSPWHLESHFRILHCSLCLEYFHLSVWISP